MSSGEKAIDKAEEDKPDLVLMDIVLKGKMDGIEAAEIIRSRFHITIIYLTAYGDDKFLTRAKITEPFGYLLKPFQEREIHISVEIALYKCSAEKKRKKLKEEKRELIKELDKTITKVKILSGLIPICASCKKIRNDNGFWLQLEEYIQEHSEAEFTHGLRPGCSKKALENLAIKT